MTAPTSPASPRDESPDLVAETPVPLEPAFAWERGSQLIQTGGIPRFGNQPHVAQDRIGADGRNDPRITRVHTPVGLAGKDGSQIKPKTIDMIHGDPVSQAVEISCG